MAVAPPETRAAPPTASGPARLLAASWLLLLPATLVLPQWLHADNVGDARTRLTVRLALAYYALALGLMLFLSGPGWASLTARGRLARAAWTAGWLTYLVHLAMAFHYYHHWSHHDAVRRTAAVSGFGAGIYVSHLFTLVWTADVASWWLWPRWYAGRPRWLDALLHGFMLVVVFNATVVFESGPTRWVGAAGFVVLAVLAALRRSGARAEPVGG
jgi:hypothetical protein